ncbi:MAG: CYTH domain-containing protein [Prevotella sp.]|nr:CYTH domain-containing protein [Prevotella sp.]
MSGFEIERKFLVKKGGAYKDTAFSCSHIQQGYIPADGATVRIRLRDEQAFLTIKGRSEDGGLSRYEFEKEITRDEAEHLLKICRGGIIDKHRYLVKSPDGRHTFEVDEFHGLNDGLIMAEVELSSADEPFEKPDFIGREVTGDRRFYNKHMLKYPFCLWKNTIEEE